DTAARFLAMKMLCGFLRPKTVIADHFRPYPFTVKTYGADVLLSHRGQSVAGVMRVPQCVFAISLGDDLAGDKETADAGEGESSFVANPCFRHVSILNRFGLFVKRRM